MSNKVEHSELASTLGITSRTLTRWVKDGCPCNVRSPKRLYVLDDVVSWARREGKNIPAIELKPGDDGYDAKAMYELGRARKVVAEAEIAEMKSAQQRGEVVEVSAVEEEWRRVGSVTRVRMQQIPGDVSRSLVGLEAGEIEKLLTEAVADALSGVGEEVGVMSAA